MTDLFAARSQMAMSLGFHIIFAAIGVALPLLMVLAEALWLKTQDETYRVLAQQWAIGAIATGGIRVHNGVVTSGFLRPWLGLFPFTVGLLTLALFAFLAAVYLTMEAAEETLREDFRKRALSAAGAVGALALTVYLLSHETAPLVHAGLRQRLWSWPLQIVTGIFAVSAIGALWRRRFHWARVLAAGQVTSILTGWALAQYPFLIPPDISIAQAAAPLSVLRPVLWGITLGLLILAPSFLYLFRVFKSGPASTGEGDPRQ